MFMDDIRLFGTNWRREIIRQSDLYKKTLIAIIKYSNSDGYHCYIANDVLNLLPHSDSFSWKIDSKKILSKIHEACKNNEPLFICFSNMQKEAVSRALEGSSLNNVCAITADEIFV